MFPRAAVTHIGLFTRLTAIPYVSAVRSGSSFSKLVCYGNVAWLGDNMPKEVSDLYCEPCRISFKSSAGLYSHRKGQAHRMAERIYSMRAQTSARRAALSRTCQNRVRPAAHQRQHQTCLQKLPRPQRLQQARLRQHESHRLISASQRVQIWGQIRMRTCLMLL